MSNKDDKTLQYINEYYDSKEIKLNFESLNKMIIEQMNHLKNLKVQSEVIEEDAEEEFEDIFEDLFEEFERKLNDDSEKLVSEEMSDDRYTPRAGKENLTIKLPKFIVTEDWGKPDSEAFAHIRPFILRAAGKGNTYEEKFAHFQSIFKGRGSKVTSVGRIISTLILLESWAAILQQFGASSAGFLFESFLAAMTFGEQIDDKREGSLPIEDIIAFGVGPDGRPASLKLLRPDTEIKGSFKNLITYFEGKKSIDYIVAYKEGATSKDVDKGNIKLRIEKYELTRKNLIPFFLAFNSRGQEGDRNKSLIAPEITRDHKVFLSLGENSSLNDRVELLKNLSWGKLLNYFKDLFAIGGDLYDTESKHTQWYITQSQWKHGLETASLATLDLRKDTLKKLSNYWASELGIHVTEVFERVAELSENINKYFLNPDRERAKSVNGSKAIKSTEHVKKSIDGTIASENAGNIEI